MPPKPHMTQHNNQKSKQNQFNIKEMAKNEKYNFELVLSVAPYVWLTCVCFLHWD